MHIPVIFDPWFDFVRDQRPFVYQLTVGDTAQTVHMLARFEAEPQAGDEVGLRVMGLAGLSVYQILGIQHTLGHAVADTIFLQHIRQDI